MPDKRHLQTRRADEEDSGDDGDGKGGRVQTASRVQVDGVCEVIAIAALTKAVTKAGASISIAAADGSVDVALTRACARAAAGAR